MKLDKSTGRWPVTGPVAFALFVAFGIWIAVKAWQSINDNEYMACLSSMTVAVLRKEDAIRIMERSEDWYILSPTEVHLVTRDLLAGDCGQVKDLELDHLGQRIHVALRRPQQGRLSIVLWSVGRDGVEATEDDVIMPYGESIPR